MTSFDNENNHVVKDPFIEIWVKPQKTLTWIFQNNPNKYLFPLLVLSGITIALNNTFSRTNADGNFLYSLIAFEIVLGGLAGWFSLYLYSMILSWTGTWLGGRANQEKYLTVIAWSNIPWICSLIVWLLKIIIWEDKILVLESSDFSELELYLYFGFNLISTVLGVWSVIILFRGIELIQNFTFWKVLLNFLYSLLIFSVPAFIIAGLFYIFKN